MPTDCKGTDYNARMRITARFRSPRFGPLCRQKPGISAASALLAGALLVAAGWSTPATAEDPGTRLENLKAAAARIETKLKKARTSRDATSESISKLDEEINALDIRQRTIGSQMGELRDQIAGLETDLGKARSDVEAHEARISTLTRSALATGREPYLKILLNQSDPIRLARTMAWYRHVAVARARAIEDARDKINRVTQTQTKLSEQQQRLTQLDAELDAAASSLTSSRDKKGDLLASINKDINVKAARAKTLRADQLAVEQLLRELDRSRTALREKSLLEAEQNREAMAEQQRQLEHANRERANVVPPLNELDFASLKGSLPFPASGQIAARFGDPKPGSQGEFSWQGVLLHADAGATVKAVADGEVIWVGNLIRGAGEVIVIDHGDNYSSVYMHNSELLRQLGERVSAGEAIAYVGATGLDRPGLLFRLNHDTQALDPLKWLKGR